MNKTGKTILCLMVCVMTASQSASGQLEVGPSFTFQGHLRDNGVPANGNVDMTFRLFAAPSGGSSLGIESINDVFVEDGRFSVELDFGADVFNGDTRWLELEVETSVLVPRQRISATPYSTSTRGIHVSEDESFVGVGRDTPVNGDEFFGVEGQQLGNFGFAGMYVKSTGTLARPFYGYQAGNGVTARHYIRGDLADWRLENSVGEIVISAQLNNGGFQAAPTDLGFFNLDINSAGDVRLGSNGDFNDSRLNVLTSGYVGIGRDTPIDAVSWFDVETPAGNNMFGGMHVSTATETGIPFYGYAAGGTTDCFTFYNGGVNVWGLRVGGQDWLTVRGDTGRVGLSTFTPQFLLHCNGTAGKPGGGSWSVASDRRLKKDIADLEGSLERLMKLRGVSYEYRDPNAINEPAGQRIGMIAQEVEATFPDWIEERNDGYKSLSFSGFEALTVEALRELRVEKDQQIESLQDENDELRQRLETLEMAIEQLTSQHQQVR